MMKNSRKSAFIKSLIALLLCIAMLIGTTYAWFTDVASTSVNVIQTGTLDIKMYWSEDPVNGPWYDVEDDANNVVFNYDKWEPGYTEIRYLKIENNGNLALNYHVTLEPVGSMGKLADVIQVYSADNVTEKIDSRKELKGKTSWGLLSNVVGGGAMASGTLLAEGQQSPIHDTKSTIMAIGMEMITTAGNEYQEQSIGDGFTIKALASQCAFEEDSTGSNYDSNAEMPQILQGNKISALVSPVNGAVPQGGVRLSDGAVSAYLPEGTKLKSGAERVSLEITPLEESASDITVVNQEVLIPVDVHIDGVAEDNTTPIIIDLGEILPKYLNMGNYTLIHVEKSGNKSMEMIDASADFTAHNQFKYDSDTGAVAVAMANFSEVTCLVDQANGWQGSYVYDFEGDGSKENPYIISKADELAGFGRIVGGMAEGKDQNSFAGKHFKLINDINLNDQEEKNTAKIFHPIGYYYTDDKNGDGKTGDYYSTVQSFEGIFDGNGHTIGNFYQNTWEIKGDYDGNYYKDAMGLFGYVVNGTIKNLTVDHFSSDGEYTPTGCVAAYAVNSNFSNIAITNCNPRVYNTGNGGIVGIAGNTNDGADKKITLTNITVDNSNTISALWGSYDVACGGLVGMFRGNADGGNGKIHFQNCHVAAKMDVYNDVCGNYQYYAYRYAGMMIGSIRHNTKNDEGKVIPNMNGISADSCTVDYGTWNDYYYCEYEKNSLASYSEDYQFSRVPHSELNFEDLDGNGIINSLDERKTVTGCKHSHTPAEDKRAVYLPFAQLFTGYSWGVSSIGITELPGILNITEGNEEESVYKFKSKFTGDFLYRVGNENAVSVGSLFAAIKEDAIKDSGVWVSVEKVDENTNVSGTFTANTTDWENGTIKFEGTGVVVVTIQDYNFCKPTVLYLEVVDAKNTTTASFSGDTVLLNDVTVSSTLSASGVVYGNGFTVNMENAPVSEKNGAVFHLYDGATLKNLGIVGKEFTTVAMNVNDTNYGVSVVRAWGTATIENCYISGCRSAVSVTGTELTIKDSVIANGIYANVDFRSGVLNLHNVTTINEPHSVNGTTVVGLGIVGNMTASAGRELNVSGTLNQYNWVSKADCGNIKATGVDNIFNSVFTDSKYEKLRYTYDGTTYVNTGILSLCSDFGESAVTGAPSNYGRMAVTATITNISVDGYVWAPAQAGALSIGDMKYHDEAYEWTPADQGTSYVPAAFDYSNAGLMEEDGVVQIEYESGSSYTLDNATLRKLFSAKKYGQGLSYKISMDGADYTEKDIVFDANASKTYTITYTITDNQIYDKAGKLTGKTIDVEKQLKVFATVVDKGAEVPTFTFYYGTNGSASAGTPHTAQPTNSYTSKIEQSGDQYYIMPNVSETSANAIGSKTVNGKTIYYPIVDGINVRSGSSSDYDFTRYYPVFKAVKISDNGTEYSYSETKEIPATVSWVSAEIDTGNGASSLNDGFGLYNNLYLCKIQKKAGDKEAGGTAVVQYSYTALDGNTYYYYVGYRFYDEDEGGLCVTPDTLVTLADGSQKRVDSLKGDEELLVWNHETGKIDKAPIAYIVDHDGIVTEREIIHLNFANGKTVKIIGEHVFFDATLNRYVAIDGENVEEFIGHDFMALDADGKDAEKVKLISVDKEIKMTQTYEVVTYKHLTCFTEGILSTSAYLDPLLNVFDINTDTMAYDFESVQKDIETYGLYTYADFEGLISEEAFELYNAKFLKIAVGKGYITWNDILDLIDIYFNVDVCPIQ